MMELPKADQIPGRPGVYWYLKGRQVIYVGKAKNLSRRLASYRQLARLDAKTALMLRTATAVKWQALDSEIEAILTEAKLIRLYRPQFNSILKDDKSPIYLTITKEVYPRIKLTRGQGSFGPFTSGRILRQILERLRQIFPYCDAPLAGRPCFYYHLNQCPGACVNKISPKDYQKNICHLKLFFCNQKKRLLANLKKEMLFLANNQEYAAAANSQRQLEALADFWQARLIGPQLPQLSGDQVMKELERLFGFQVNRIEVYDISNLAGTHPSGGMAVAVNGQIDKSQYRLFNIRSLKTPNDPQMLTEMVRRRLKHQEWPRPDVIVVDGGQSQISAVKQVSGRIPVVGLAKRPDRLIGSTKPLDLTTAAGRLLVQLRDEAHRFGRRQHLRLRHRFLFKPSGTLPEVKLPQEPTI
jgi:excinuclease ABC subunit C